MRKRSEKDGSVEFWNPMKGEVYFFEEVTVPGSFLAFKAGQNKYL